MTKKWAIICGICALPSFTLALYGGFQGLPQIVAMLAGILTFIFAFSAFEKSRLNSRISNSSLFSRAKKFAIATKITTAIIAFIGSVALFLKVSPVMMLIFIEVYPGILSITLVQSIWKAIGLEQPNLNFEGQMNAHPWAWNWNDAAFTYLTTLIQGGLLSLTLFIFGILSLAVLSVLKRARRLH